jgi:uncharacterized membrane protein
MFDALFAVTALPNLHPALVHFPIALSAVALLFEAVLWIRWYSAPVDRGAAALWILAAAGAGATYAAGRVAADGVGALSPAAEATLASHADAGLATALTLGALALLRAWLTRRDAVGARGRRDALRIVALLGALIVQGLVAYTADLGGALVFRHGVAVFGRPAHATIPTTDTIPATSGIPTTDTIPATSGIPTTAAIPATAAIPTTAASSQLESATSSRFSHLEDGTMVWKPRSGDEAALGEILTPVGATAVRVATASADTEGLSLLVSGRTLLVFPDAWEDVQLEARVDSSEFDGSLALGARVSGDSTGGFFRVRSDDTTQLVARQAGEEEILDEAHSSVSGGVKTLGLSAVGRHWKGFIDGVTVVHGHRQLPASGRVALLLDGTGTVRLISVRISPVNAGKTDEKAREEHSRGH